MRILVISQYFWPENFRINDLVEGFVTRGHEVTVLTGMPNYPAGKFFQGYGWREPSRETYCGASVIRVPLIPRGRGGGFSLALNYCSFVVTACWAVLFRLSKKSGFEAIFVFEPSPITVGIASALARWRFRIPVLFWVLDLWPESLVAVGAVRSKFLISLVGKMVRWIYKNTDCILAPSQAFVPEIVKHGVSCQKVKFFPNWAESVFKKESVNPSSLGWPDGFSVLFAGNIGAAQDFPSVVEAARLLKDREDIHWVVVGDGRMGAWAQEEVRRLGLEKTMHFLGQRPLEEMPAHFIRADVLLLSLRQDPVFALTIPGKLQSYLASGKPILSMLDGEAARIVSESGAGFACGAGKSADLALAVERFAGMSPEERASMGMRGRTYFEKHFARETVFDSLETMLAAEVGK